MSIWALLCAFGSLLLWGIAALLAWQSHKKESGKRQLKPNALPEALKEWLLIRAPLEAARRTGMLERFQLPLAGFHARLLVLKGQGWGIVETERYVAQAVGLGWTAWTASALLALLSHEGALLAFGAIIGIMLPVAKYRESGQQMERRRQDMVLALPDVLGKLMLLVGAGETVQRAIIRCVEGREESASDSHIKGKKPRKKAKLVHPLYAEWTRMVRSLENGQSFAQAIEAFSRRCAVQEASMFATVVLLHYRKGGDRFVLALKELSFSLWEKRKATARMRGEEASSKLVFPLAGIFFLLLIAVAAPAVLMMP
ncbi:type II secretion system F family protein [Paenibacillus sp. MMS18-CY102]|uniref:type II secretion system F family protein n=1 Tax=Paenibacillus sp. MMS18-CY102 TaxID=2682849 RepID=UPI0013653269|nr:type II secretion system F family protein [Paenibacillus sp. MMS18-CY102]MWC30106.1 type II secretion protein F [Paenibacillus sp. MMS18-CY102]